eukprot:86221_1
MIVNTAGNDEPQSNDEKQTALSLWAEQYRLNDVVMDILRDNEINSLDDFQVLENDEDINDFVASLGLKTFIIKKKLIKAIRHIRHKISKKQHNENDDEKKSIEMLCTDCKTIIRWDDIDAKMMNIETAQIQSNKHQNVTINETHETRKYMLAENRVNMSYVNGLFTNWITKALWKGNSSSKAVAVVTSPSCFMLDVLTTVTGAFPALYKYNQHQENKQLTYKKERNAQSKIFNDKLSQIKQCEEWILPKIKELEKQEQMLNSHVFQLERFCDLEHKSRVVMMIGPTGFGKSLVSNRLLGIDDSVYDISEAKENAYEFDVAQIGDTDSITDKLTKKSKIVHIIDENKLQSFVLSVIDTPGAFDSKGNDNDHNNMMAHYFEACGGINGFGIVFLFGG